MTRAAVGQAMRPGRGRASGTGAVIAAALLAAGLLAAGCREPSDPAPDPAPDPAQAQAQAQAQAPAQAQAQTPTQAQAQAQVQPQAGPAVHPHNARGAEWSGVACRWTGCDEAFSARLTPGIATCLKAEVSARECYAEEAGRQIDRLDGLVRRLRVQASPAGRARLDRSQKRWEALIDPVCAHDQAMAGHGSGWADQGTFCAMEMYARRRIDLEAMEQRGAFR